MKYVSKIKVAKDVVGGKVITTTQLNGQGWGYETTIQYSDNETVQVATYDTLNTALMTHGHIVLHERAHSNAIDKMAH